MIAANPCVVLESGNIRTCPVRLSFPHLFKPQAPMEDGGKSSTPPRCSSRSALISPFSGCSLEDGAGEVAERWTGRRPDAAHAFPQAGRKAPVRGLHGRAASLSPLRASVPPVVDVKTLPIVEEDKVYPGCWVIATIRPFTFDAKMKKGVCSGCSRS